MTRRRGITIAALGVLLILLVGFTLALTKSGYTSELTARFGEHNQPATLTDLHDLGQFGTAFDHNAGAPRLVLLLSPT